jgi:hypothetical protein
LKNQQFYRRNLMPSMLGWFSLRPETTPEDIAWMLAMGAGYDAGFGLSTSLETLKKHGKREEMLDLIKTWEGARLQGVFSASQKERMRSLKNEFQLKDAGNNGYVLTPVYNAHFRHEQKVRQPGEPVFSSFTFDNPGAMQPLTFILAMAPEKDKSAEVTFDEASITVNHQDALVLPASLTKDQILYCDGTTVKLYNRQWQLLQTLNLARPLPMLSAGKNEIRFDGKYSGENGASIKLEIRAKGTPEMIPGK